MPSLARSRAVAKPPRHPRIFISHDSRDARLADAFAQLLKSASPGRIECFHSSDMGAGGGIGYGDEWFKALMAKLAQATDVVCLLTPRSVERPWILFEAGVARGKRATPVHGVTLGLKQAVSGPFAQYQLCDGSEDALMKLVRQLCGSGDGPGLPDADLRKLVQDFRGTVDSVSKERGAFDSGQRWQRRIPVWPGADIRQRIDALLDQIREEVRQFVADLGKPIEPARIRANVLLPDPVVRDETQFPGQLAFVAWRPENSYSKRELSNRFAPGEGVSGKVFLDGVAFAQDGRVGVARRKLDAMHPRLSSVAGFPLLDPDSKTAFGVICVDLTDAESVTEDDLLKLRDYRPVRDLVGEISKLLNPRECRSFELEYLARL
jgi:hypothetical protein